MDLYLKKRQLNNFNALLKSSEEDAEINIEKFKSLLAEVDSQMKNLPATAQVNIYRLFSLDICFYRVPHLMLRFVIFYTRLLLNKVVTLLTVSIAWKYVKLIQKDH